MELEYEKESKVAQFIRDTFGVWTKRDTVVAFSSVTATFPPLREYRHGMQLSVILDDFVGPALQRAVFSRQEMTQISCLLQKIFGQNIKSKRLYWALLPLNPNSQANYITHFYKVTAKRPSFEDSFYHAIGPDLKEGSDCLLDTNEVRTQFLAPDVMLADTPVDDTFRIDAEMEQGMSSCASTADKELLCNGREQVEQETVSRCATDYLQMIERELSELVRRPGGESVKAAKFVISAEEYVPLPVTDPLAQAHDCSPDNKTYRYYYQGLSFDYCPNVFPTETVDAFKMWIWTQCPMWKEFGCKVGSPASYKGRLYNWFGAHGNK